MTMTVSTSLDDLASQIANASRAATRTPQLPNSSIDDGALQLITGGVPSGLVGTMFDGTTGSYVVNGPVPPRTGKPTLETVPSGVRIRWVGDFVGATAPPPGVAATPLFAPMDFKVVECEVSSIETFPPGPNTKTAPPIQSESGGYTFQSWGEGTPLYARLRVRSLSGKVSEWSEVGGPVAAGRIGLGDIAFDIAGLGGAKLFYQPDQPTGLTANDRAMWWDSDDENRPWSWDGATWTDLRIGGAAIRPKTLIGGDLIADGSVTGSLFQALMVLTTAVVAGDPAGDHARMTPTGFRVYTMDLVDGIPNEATRIGSDTNDYITVTDQDGRTRASIADDGSSTFSRVVTQELAVAGADIVNLLAEKSEGLVGRFATTLTTWIEPIVSEYGVMEVVAPCIAGRAYLISFTYVFLSRNAGDEIRYRVRASWNSNSSLQTQPGRPTITSHELNRGYHSGEQAGRFYRHTDSFIFYPGVQTAGTTITPPTSMYRFLLTAEKGAVGPNAVTTGTISIVGTPIEATVQDLGPAGLGVGGAVTAGGGTLSNGTAGASPTGVQQGYYVDLGWAGRASWRGNGTLRTDTTDVIQGWDPTGVSGDQTGMFWFNLPNITGTVTRVDLYLYSSHWYYVAGGTAIINISDQRGTGAGYAKLRGDWHVPGYVRAGAKTVTVPADWFPFFRGTTLTNGNGRAMAISLGNSDGTDGRFYGRFTDCRLRVWYTQ